MKSSTVLPGQEAQKSLWRDTCEIEKRESLPEQLKKTEAAVIGAGMAGILTTYLLKKRGIEAILLEAGEIAGGVTENTTAKITSQHDLIYHRLIEEFGREKAGQYARANQGAILQYREIIKENGIDCDLSDLPAYLYTLEEERLDELRKEAEAAKSLGIPAVFLDEGMLSQDEGFRLPFPVKGAVRFDDQSQFHPLKFIRGISSELTVYEQTKVQNVEWEDRGDGREGRSLIQTDRGTIEAAHVVFACHYPFVNVPGYYFIRMHQERSYVLALSGAADVGGMYIGVDQQGYSFRNQGGLLLLGGLGHRTGENQSGGCYEALRKAARKWYPNGKEVYAWSAQDCMTMDGVPYIGRYAASRPRWYVATGFRKWGMTSSMAAAAIISDMILASPEDQGGPLEIGKNFLPPVFNGSMSRIEDLQNNIFSPQRFTPPTSPGDLWKDVKTIGKALLKGIFDMPDEAVSAILPGHGGIVEYKGEKVGIYRDQEGVLHRVDPRCTHMGCQLGWNPEELTWDCPCHGSRFDADGAVIDNPAMEDLPAHH